MDPNRESEGTPTTLRDDEIRTATSGSELSETTDADVDDEGDADDTDTDLDADDA